MRFDSLVASFEDLSYMAEYSLRCTATFLLINPHLFKRKDTYAGYEFRSSTEFGDYALSEHRMAGNSALKHTGLFLPIRSCLSMHERTT